MEQLATFENSVIEYDGDAWRLVMPEPDSALDALRVLVEVRRGSGLRLNAQFAAHRRLPAEDGLSPADIERVVLGWSHKDASWQLGLMLTSTLAEGRGSRWCGLATWPDSSGTIGTPTHLSAADAGQKLAALISKPFTVVPRKVETPAASPAPQVYTTPAAPVRLVSPPAALPPMPYKLGHWSFGRDASGALAFTLERGYVRGRILRAVWYLFWAVAFVVLSLTSLTSGIALPQPAVLPYVGFGCAVVMVIIALYTALSALRQPRRVLVNGLNGTIRWMRGDKLAQSLHAGEIQGIYASQVVTRASEKKPRRHLTYGEVNAYLQDGRFVPLVSRLDMDEKYDVIVPADAPRDEDAVRPLSAHETHNSVQAAAVQVADALGVPAWDDLRVK